MAIINKDYYFFINSDGTVGERMHGGKPVSDLQDWNDKQYWMVEFIHGDAFKTDAIEKIAPEVFLKSFQDGSITLLIVHISEAYHYVIDYIYSELVIRRNIPADNILFLTNSADINLEIEIVASKYNLPKLKSMYMVSYEYGAKGDLQKYPDDCVVNTLADKIYDKKFLSLNGLWRPHRVLLGSFLKSLNLLNYGNMSLNSVPCDFPPMHDTFNSMLDWCKNNTEGQELLLKDEQGIKSLPIIYLDGENPIGVRASYTIFNKSYYENTYFSIVTETLGWSSGSGEGATIGRALSEKTFKPILFKHPFLLIALPKALELLRELGYRTFSECIDESYDNEYDDSKRVYMVAKEAERLCNLSESELKDFLKVCREITNHNFAVLKNKQKFLYQKT